MVTFEREEDEIEAPHEIHPEIVAWIKRQLNVTHLGYFTQRYLEEDLAERLNLSLPFSELEEDDRNDLEKGIAKARRWDKDYVGQIMQNLPEESTRESIENALLNVSSPTRVGRSTAKETRERGTGNEQLELKNLLSPSEQSCAWAITEFHAALLARLPVVQELRSQIWGKRNEALSVEEANQFIFSPVARLLSFEECARLSVPLREQRATVKQWKSFYVSAEAIKERVKTGVNIYVDLPALEGHVHLYQAIIHIESLDRTITKEAAGKNEDILLWVPFAPADAIDRRDHTKSPRIFAGSIADELRLLSEHLSEALPWDTSQIAKYLLTNELPCINPVRASRLKPWSIEVQNIGSELYVQLIEQQHPLRGYIRIQSEPWVSGETIKKYYVFCQREILSRQNEIKNSKPTKQPSHSEKRPLLRTPKPDVIQIARLVAKLLCSSSKGKFALLSIHKKLMQDDPSLSLRDYSSFLRAYKRACAFLHLPNDTKWTQSNLKDS